MRFDHKKAPWYHKSCPELAGKKDELNIPGGYKMSYNQNHKLAQITFQTLIIGVDVAKFTRLQGTRVWKSLLL
jgi:hypothetical protein